VGKEGGDYMEKRPVKRRALKRRINAIVPC